MFLDKLFVELEDETEFSVVGDELFEDFGDGDSDCMGVELFELFLLFCLFIVFVEFSVCRPFESSSSSTISLRFLFKLACFDDFVLRNYKSIISLALLVGRKNLNNKRDEKKSIIVFFFEISFNLFAYSYQK